MMRLGLCLLSTLLVFGSAKLTPGQVTQMDNPQEGDPTSCVDCRHVAVRHIDAIKRLAKIKAEILRHRSSQQPPFVFPTPTPPTPVRLVVPKARPLRQEHELADILCYSEPPDRTSNIMGESVVQFTLTDSKRPLVVKSANLLIRIKYKKDKDNSAVNANKTRRRKKQRARMVDLVISTVMANGTRGQVVASVKSKLRKTKWLKLNLPHELVQQAVDSKNKTLQVYVECQGCGNRARLILVHKRKKGRRANSKNNKTSYKLNKRRPMLFLHTTVPTGSRHRRSVHVQHFDAASRKRSYSFDSDVDNALYHKNSIGQRFVRECVRLTTPGRRLLKRRQVLP